MIELREKNIENLTHKKSLANISKAFLLKKMIVKYYFTVNFLVILPLLELIDNKYKPLLISEILYSVW